MVQYVCVAAGCLIGKCCWNIKRAEDNVPHLRKEPHVCIGVDLKVVGNVQTNWSSFGNSKRKERKCGGARL